MDARGTERKFLKDRRDEYGTRGIVFSLYGFIFPPAINFPDLVHMGPMRSMLGRLRFLSRAGSSTIY